MKAIAINFPLKLAAFTIAASSCLQAISVTVDSNISSGYVSISELNEFGMSGTYVGGNSLLLADVKSTPGLTSVILEGNYSYYENNPDAIWRSNAGAGPNGNRWLSTSTYAEYPNTFFTDNICNFKAVIGDYTLAPGYALRAFVKGFDATYATNEQVYSDPLVSGSIVDLTLDTTTWVNIQYGFEVQGVNANPANPIGSATANAALNVVTPIVYGVPNAGFEIPGGAQWVFGEANGHTVNYPAAGGNPGGFAVMDGTAATQPYYSVLVANSGRFISLPSLSLIPGQSYVLSMDMKILAGASIGGLKVEFSPGPENTGDVFPAISGTGAEWATYSFPFTVPAGSTGVKLVPLWGGLSSVGYDNIRLAGPFSAKATTTATDIVVSWPTVTGKNYQVMKSTNLSSWALFGSSVAGDGTVLSTSDPLAAPGKAFFQVIESAPAPAP